MQELQRTDDSLLADPNYALDILGLLRRKKRNFVSMVTVDQFCDNMLMEEGASSGMRISMPWNFSVWRFELHPH